MTPEPDPFRGPWFDSKTAAAYVPCKNVAAWYAWRKRHHIVTRSNGSVAKADLDRALSVKTPTRRGRHPNSRANLRKRPAMVIAAQEQPFTHEGPHS